MSAVVVGTSFVSLVSAYMRKLARPQFLLSKSNPPRWASIWFGTDNRVHPHTASVLTWLKIEERQTFDDRLLYAPKHLYSKGFRLCQVADSLETSLEIRRKQTVLPRGGLRPSERPMMKKEIVYIWHESSKTRASIWLW